MNNIAWTPGPWEWSATDNERHSVVSPPVDAEHDFGPWFTAIISCSDDAVEDANARLIAAAPELYEALSDIMENPLFQTGIGGNPNMVEALMDRATAALAKARGQ